MTGDALSVLEDWILEDRGREYLLVPLGKLDRSGTSVAPLAAFLAALGLARPLVLRRPDQLPLWWRVPREAAISDCRWFRVYRLRRGFADQMRLEALRQHFDADEPIQRAASEPRPETCAAADAGPDQPFESTPRTWPTRHPLPAKVRFEA